MAFENLNSLETLSIQNNKLQRIPEEVMEPIIDTLRVVDIMGKFDWSCNQTSCQDLLKVKARNLQLQIGLHSINWSAYIHSS